jgi:hypothetical protein
MFFVLAAVWKRISTWCISLKSTGLDSSDPAIARFAQMATAPSALKYRFISTSLRG